MTAATLAAEAPPRIDDLAAGREMHRLATELFPINRSLTGNGVRQTLAALKRHVPALTVHEIPSGTQVFDWIVPDEWNVRDAYLLGPDGEKIVSFKDHNLHLVGYSEPVDTVLDLDDLQAHLYSLPEQPDAIPYITSYYKRRWGFCLPHRLRESLKPGRYRAVVDSTLEPGHLTYGEVMLPGETRQEVFLSTYVCHPSMANNELSGPLVTTWIAKWLAAAPRRYTYRIVFIPETIGSIAYLSRNLEAMQRNVIAGFNISCVGDERCFSFLPTRAGNTLSDRAALHVLHHLAPDYITYTFLDRGSDERQYNAPGVGLPVACILRSKYGMYPEYHTSLDDLTLVTAKGLGGSLEAYRRAIECIEQNETYKVTVLGEPQLGKRGLYPTISSGKHPQYVGNMMNMIAYCDGSHDLIDIAGIIGVPMWDLFETVDTLRSHGLLAPVRQAS